MRFPAQIQTDFDSRVGARSSERGFSLAELIVTLGIAGIILVVLGLLSANGLQSFLVMGNCTALDDKSRLAADQITRELRQATKVVSYDVEADSRTLVFTNSVEGFAVEYVWNATTRTLTCEKTGEPQVTSLADCDAWSAGFFQSLPQASVTQPYLPATNGSGQLDLEQARVVTLSWKCSRPVTGSKARTESVRTVQIALRNASQP